MNFVDLAPKKRKIEQSVKDDVIKNELNGQTSFPTTNIYNGIFLSCFLDRLKLKTIPHISPLLERLTEAENKNVTALKSIDKINRRIKELEYHVEKGIKTGTTLQVAVGTDLTDCQSHEFKIIMNALQSSSLTPFKPPTSQAFRQNESLPKQITPIHTQRPICPRRNGNSVDLTNEISRQNGVHKQNNLMSKPNPLKLDIISAQFLPVSNVTALMGNPRLTWDLAADGICLQWNVPFIDPSVSPLKYEISSFQKSEITMNIFPWRKIGEVDALPLPMACTLTYVAKMNTYFFAIRAWVKEDVASAWSNVIMVEIN